MWAVLEPGGLDLYQYQLDPYAGCGHQCCDCYAARRESFILVCGKRPLTELHPLPVGVRVSELPALVASLPRLSEADATQSTADLDAGHGELADVELRDAWLS
jgi:hypothetical protein